MVSVCLKFHPELSVSSLLECMTSVSVSDCSFSAFFPSTVACACVSIASWKLKLVDRGAVSQTVLQLAQLLSQDAVSPVQRTRRARSSASVTLPRLQTELHSPLLPPPGKCVGRKDALVSAVGGSDPGDPGVGTFCRSRGVWKDQRGKTHLNVPDP